MSRRLNATPNEIARFATKLSRVHPVRISAHASNVDITYPNVFYTIDVLLSAANKHYLIEHRENCQTDYESCKGSEVEIESDELVLYGLELAKDAQKNSAVLQIAKRDKELTPWQSPLEWYQAKNIADFFDTKIKQRDFYTTQSLSLATNQPDEFILAAAHAFHKPTIKSNEFFEYDHPGYLQDPDTLKNDWEKRLYDMFSIPNECRNPESANFVSTCELEDQLQYN